MEDASAITSLPDHAQVLKQIILNLSRERDEHRKLTERFRQRVDELETAKLRLEMELFRLKKWYYGPRADRLQTAGDVAQMLLTFATDLESRSVNPDGLARCRRRMRVNSLDRNLKRKIAHLVNFVALESATGVHSRRGGLNNTHFAHRA
jgi:hypothetical protein